MKKLTFGSCFYTKSKIRHKAYIRRRLDTKFLDTKFRLIRNTWLGDAVFGGKNRKEQKKDIIIILIYYLSFERLTHDWVMVFIWLSEMNL